MDSIILLLREMLKKSKYINSYREILNGCEIKTKEGIKYSCYMEKDKYNKNYYLYNRYYEKKCRLSIKTINSKYFNENIILEIFENHILQNEILYKTFKEGMKSFKERNTDFDISTLFSNDIYLEYTEKNELEELVCYIWNKGYEFASKFPNPDIIAMQYEFLKKRAIEKVNIETIMEFMLRNKDIHIYLDEKSVSEKAKELDNVKEIEYSYGHIVARAKTYDIKMNLLPLDGEILVFDTEGVNEIARCNVEDYSIEYEIRAINEMFKSIRNFELEGSKKYDNFIKKEKEENEQEE